LFLEDHVEMTGHWNKAGFGAMSFTFHGKSIWSW